MRLLPCFLGILSLSIAGGLVPMLTSQTISKTSRQLAAKPSFPKPSATNPSSVPSFPKVEEFRLQNGLKVILAENQSPERVSFYVQCLGGSAMDAVGKEGASAVLAQALVAAIRSRAGATVGIGAALGNDTNRVSITVQSTADAFSFGVAVSQSKFPATVKLVGDVLSRPPFVAPGAAADVYAARQHVLVANQVAQGSADAPRLALEAMAAEVVYGSEHPYSRSATEQSLRSLTPSDIQAAYTMLSMPNNTTVVVLGRVTKKNLLPLLTKAFGQWKSADAPYMTRPRPQPMEQGVYWVEFSNAAPVTALAFEAPPRNDMDYDAMLLAATLLEKRINARLMTTMATNRTSDSAQAAFTLSDNKYANVLVCKQWLKSMNNQAEQHVSQAKTLLASHALVRDELQRFLAEAPTEHDAEIASCKSILLERYAEALRRPESLAAMLLNADANGLSLKELQAYPKRLLALTSQAVNAAIARAVPPTAMVERPPVIVLGKSTLADGMQSLGKVHRYSAAGEEILTLDESDITLDSLLRRHTQALGGADAIAGITTLTTTTETQLSVMAQKFPGTILTKQKIPNKISRKLEIAATQILQELWCDGKTAFDKIEMMGQEQALAQRSPKETESALFDAQIFPALTMQLCGFTPELLGRRDGYYILKASAESGTVKTLALDGKTFLLASIEEMRQTPQGIIKSVQEFREYGVFGGVTLPTTIVLKTGSGVLIGKNAYKINLPLEDEEFRARH
ncbi:MAG: insulinase family protein [Ignavibacteria bacterium]|nr:insulinase family protein [Ignavibacteria bacterium]